MLVQSVVSNMCSGVTVLVSSCEIATTVDCNPLYHIDGSTEVKRNIMYRWNIWSDEILRFNNFLVNIDFCDLTLEVKHLDIFITTLTIILSHYLTCTNPLAM